MELITPTTVLAPKYNTKRQTQLPTVFRPLRKLKFSAYEGTWPLGLERLIWFIVNLDATTMRPFQQQRVGLRVGFLFPLHLSLVLKLYHGTILVFFSPICVREELVTPQNIYRLFI